MADGSGDGKMAWTSLCTRWLRRSGVTEWCQSLEPCTGTAIMPPPPPPPAAVPTLGVDEEAEDEEEVVVVVVLPPLDNDPSGEPNSIWLVVCCWALEMVVPGVAFAAFGAFAIIPPAPPVASFCCSIGGIIKRTVLPHCCCCVGIPKLLRMLSSFFSSNSSVSAPDFVGSPCVSSLPQAASSAFTFSPRFLVLLDSTTVVLAGLLAVTVNTHIRLLMLLLRRVTLFRPVATTSSRILATRSVTLAQPELFLFVLFLVLLQLFVLLQCQY
uniref:Uncharacterized protein n=1 Tax=Anopheles farauti TaxID=69004 RepID=A0A182Q1W8_9DIPT